MEEAGELWNLAQSPSERVEDFVTCLRKAARRLKLLAEILHYAVNNGLREPIRLHVLQQGVKTLVDTVRAAKVAEAAATAAPDAMSVLVLDAMQVSAKVSERQAAEMKQLVASVATPTAAQASPGERTNATAPIPVQQQTQQRRRRRTSSGRHMRSAQRVEQGETLDLFAVTIRHRQCGRCGYAHRAGNCRADGQECRRCGNTGHFARVCRSAKPDKD
jgi:hypothetical protein